MLALFNGDRETTSGWRSRPNLPAIEAGEGCSTITGARRLHQSAGRHQFYPIFSTTTDLGVGLKDKGKAD